MNRSVPLFACIFTLFSTLLSATNLSAVALPAQNKPVQAQSSQDHAQSQPAQKGLGPLVIKNTSGVELGHFKNSIALLVAVSDYNNGWPKLESVTNEITQVEIALISKGYTIVRVDNPNSQELQDAYDNFINKYGYEKDNQLLFFYTGHGHTMTDNNKTYLVPIDAPHPDVNPTSFKQKSLDMNQLLSWSRQMDAKHGLFVFDSCFSGMIFKQKGVLPKTAEAIGKWTGKPVRQFITAGSAGETVPANSTFTPAFVDAIEGRADLNKDGYVIGTELGLFLQSEVPKYVAQTPQYGKINDYRLSRGDFVFFTDQLVNNHESTKLVDNLDNLKDEPIDKSTDKSTDKPIETAKLDLALPRGAEDDTAQLESAILQNNPTDLNKAARPWYKNPWFWAGTIAAGTFAATQLHSNDSNEKGTIIIK